MCIRDRSNTDAITALTKAGGTLETMKKELTNKIGEAQTTLDAKVKKNTQDIDAITKKGGTIDTAITALKNREVKSNTTAINNLSVTVAENKRATDGSLKKLEEAFNKRISGQSAGQVHLGIEIGKNSKMGMRYFRTSMGCLLYTSPSPRD